MITEVHSIARGDGWRLLSAVCAGCQWNGFGFRADGAEMPRLRQVLALDTGAVVADVGAGKGGLTLALASEVGSNGRVFSTEIDPGRLRGLREALAAAKLDNVTVVEASIGETGLPPNCPLGSYCLVFRKP